MKKVLFVATVVKLHIMTFHLPYLKWFKENGYEVHVAAKNDYEKKEDCDIPFCDRFFDLPLERSPWGGNNLRAGKRLRQIISEQGYGIIHCHTPIGGAVGRIAAAESRKKGTKVFYTAHGFHFYKGAPLLNWILYYPAERCLAGATDVLITINREDYGRAAGFRAGKVEYIPGVGVDLGRYLPVSSEDRQREREKLGIGKEEILLLSAGELNRNKNHRVALEAVGKLNCERIRYMVCGQGPLEESLKKRARELGIERQVIFPGFRKDLPALLGAADIFVFPSFREGLSLSLMEAMAAGLPVVCSGVRGNVELIENGKGGFLVRPDDENGFAEKIGILLECGKKREEMGMANREKVREYSVENVLRRYAAIVGSDG